VIPTYGLVLPDAREMLLVALDTALKASALLVLAFVVHLAVGRRRALFRSALWNACLVGLLLLLVASPALPRLRIPVLPDRSATAHQVDHLPGHASLPSAVSINDFLNITYDNDNLSSVLPTQPVEDLEVPRAGASLISASTRETPPTSGGAFSLSELILGLYLLGTMVLLLRLAGSLAAVGRMRRRCEGVEEPSWVEGLERSKGRLGIGRRVSLLTSDGVSVPFVIGWVRPAIVLPRALAGSAETQLVDAVLVHELAHIRRGDFGWNLLLRLVQALYWPHPLVWPIGRTIGAVREQACDDLCVHVLGSSDDYRASLVEVASALVRRPGPSLGLAMARATTTALGRRLAWIDRSRGSSRCLLRWPARLALALAILGIASLLSSIELAHAKADPDKPLADNGPEAPKPSEKPRVASESPDSVEITVLAKDTGKPLKEASVRASIDFQHRLLNTNQNGKVSINLARRMFRDTLSFDVWAEGYVQQRFFFAQDNPKHPQIPTRFTVELLPGEETLGGKVVNEKNQPISGVTVEIWGYLGEKKVKQELAYMVSTTTDEQGNWRCRCFREMKFAYLYLSHPDYLNDDEFHPRAHGQPNPTKPPQASEQPLKGLRDFSDVEVMTRGVEVVGVLLDEREDPISGAEVTWTEADQIGNLQFSPPKAQSDAKGRFHFPHARAGKLLLVAKAKRHAPELKRVEAKEGMELVTIKLGPARTVSGRVVDTKSKPIPGAFVNVEAWRGYRSLGVRLSTNAEGRFRWEEAPADSFQINISRNGYLGESRRQVLPEQSDILTILKRSLNISGSLSDADSAEKIGQAEIEVGIPDPKTGTIAWNPGSRMNTFANSGEFFANLDAEKSPEYRLRIQARGYEPFTARVFRSEERSVEYDVKLTKAKPAPRMILSGSVNRPDGTPLANAEVTVMYPRGNRGTLQAVYIENGAIQPTSTSTIVKTDAKGQFSLNRESGPNDQYFALVVVHPDFFAEVNRAAFEASTAITAQPWGRIEGLIQVGGQPASGAEVHYFADRLGNQNVPFLSDSGRTVADAGGRFLLERVVPGDVRVSRGFGEGSNLKAWSNGTLLEVLPGETARVEVGGRGRPVIARVAPPTGFGPQADCITFSEFQIESDRPFIPFPKEIRARRGQSMIDRAKQWWASTEGHAYRRNWFRLSQAKLQPDGTIRAEDLPPGDYRLSLSYSANPLTGLGRSPELTAYATKQFTIPEIPGGRSDEPFDLGVLHPKPKQTLQVGQTVPPFDVETLDGKRLTLADFRGKYVLLDFWATWCGPCIAEIPELKEVHQRFGSHERFAMLSLSVDAEKEAPRKFVAEKELSWQQGFLGEWSEGGIQDAYHVEAIPATFLIGPDGKLVARDLRGEAISAAVTQALGTP